MYFIPRKTTPSTAKVHDGPYLSPDHKLLFHKIFGIPACWITSKALRTLCKSPSDFEFHDHTLLNTEKNNPLIPSNQKKYLIKKIVEDENKINNRNGNVDFSSTLCFPQHVFMNNFMLTY